MEPHPAPDGADLIQNAQSGMYLDNGFSLSNFAQIVQAPASGNLNQQWLLNVGQEPNGNYVPTSIINAYSRMALDNSSPPPTGSPIDQFQLTGTLNQQWVLLPAGNAVFLGSGGSSSTRRTSRLSTTSTPPAARSASGTSSRWPTALT